MPVQHCEAEFTALYNQHQRAIRAHLARLLGSARPDRPDLLDDLTQDTFLRLWHALHERGLRLDPSQRTRAYLFRIATNLVRDLVRREQCVPMERLRRCTSDEDPVAWMPEPASTPWTDALDRLIDVQQALLALPAPTRVLVLRAAAGYSPCEPTEKSRLARARAALRQATRAGEEPRHA